MARIARQAAFDLLWPNHCQECRAHGGTWYSFDPSPTGSRAPSLGPGSMEDFDTCSVCIERGLCPRCAKPLNGPTWRPINLRAQAALRLYALATALQHARLDELALRQLWWRAAALFREHPTPITWAIFHPIDRLWSHVYDTYSRPSRASQAVFALQTLLERGVYDEWPCYSCGWNWGKSPGDARDLGDCECWIASWEEEEAQVRADLELLDAEQRAAERLDVFVPPRGGDHALFLDHGDGRVEPLERIHITLAPELGEGDPL